MAEKPTSLGAFFDKKKKKAPKGTNMNNEATTSKVEEKKTKSKDKEEEGWEDEQIVAPTMNIEMAGRLTREEESKDQEDTVAPAWGSTKQKGGGADNPKLNEKRFPTLAKSVGQSSNINIDDGSQPNINIKTTKNMFANLGGGDDSEDDGPKRPKEIKPAMVKKAQGETAKEALQREVDKYTKKDDKKSKKKKKADEDEEEDDEEEEEEDEEVEEVVAKKNYKKDVKKPVKAKETEKQEVEEVEEDSKIVPDEVASRAKYIGKEKLEVVPVPARDLKQEKVQNDSGASKKGKKKNAFMEEEEKGNRKLLVADWDD